MSCKPVSFFDHSQLFNLEKIQEKDINYEEIKGMIESSASTVTIKEGDIVEAFQEVAVKKKL